MHAVSLVASVSSSQYLVAPSVTEYSEQVIESPADLGTVSQVYSTSLQALVASGSSATHEYLVLSVVGYIEQSIWPSVGLLTWLQINSSLQGVVDSPSLFSIHIFPSSWTG